MYGSFSVDSDLVCYKSTSISRENTALGAAILCLAVCMCDVMNKVSMCGTSVCYVLSKLFFCFFVAVH